MTKATYYLAKVVDHCYSGELTRLAMELETLSLAHEVSRQLHIPVDECVTVVADLIFQVEHI